ncbi:MAG: polysaccharide deacetylase family protein [Acidobacteriota bacterium]|nr:polysaccharide deacetylase family protein [Acidobacteriota bacterium]
MQTAGGFAAFRRLNRRRVLILTYHRFAETEIEGRVSAAQFRAHLEFLKANYRVLPLAEIAENLRGRKSLPDNAAAITIDDGYRDVFDIAFPVLKQFQIPATVFVITDFLDRKCWLWTDKARVLAAQTKNSEIEFENRVFNLNGAASRKSVAAKINQHLKRLPDVEKEKRLEDLQKSFAVDLTELPSAEFSAINWSEAKEMDANGVSIESHTVSHPILTNIADERLRFELTESKRRLSEILGREADLFCYPNGGFDERAKKFVGEAGYKAAVTTEIGFNDFNSDLFALKRTDAQPAMIDFEQYASGFELAKTSLRKIV